MPLLDLQQQYRTASCQGLERASQHVQLTPLDVDLDHGDVIEPEGIERADLHLIARGLRIDGFETRPRGHGASVQRWHVEGCCMRTVSQCYAVHPHVAMAPRIRTQHFET